MYKIAVAAAALFLASALASPPVRHPAPTEAPAALEEAGIVSGQAKSLEIGLHDPPTIPLTERFDQAVEEWISELSAEPEFARWAEAKWRREPLGPGMHGWIVLLSLDGTEIGYLVVAIDPSGAFQLSEYGTGEYPLFSTHTLYQSLVRHALIASSLTYEQFANDDAIFREPHYYSSLHNVWLVTIDGDDYWLDGKSGELLPLSPAMLEKIEDSPDHAGDFANLAGSRPEAHELRLTRALTLPAYDPFYDLSWIRKPDLHVKDLRHLQTMLDQRTKLTYVTDLYDGAVQYAFSVTGYHEWSFGGPFLRLAHLGARYLPAAAIMPAGRFYASAGGPGGGSEGDSEGGSEGCPEHSG